MNTGAHCIAQVVPYLDALRSVLERLPASEFVPNHPDGKYASTGWKAATFQDKKGQPTSLASRYPEIGQILREHFQCSIKSVAFLAMEPDAWIKPHRDLRATMEFGYVRLHVPIVTHSDVDFRVSKKRVRMNSGELWALNTSYLHQVVNKSPVTRVHFVLDAELNAWAWRMLPKKGVAWYAHAAFFFGYVGYMAVAHALSGPKNFSLIAQKFRRHVLGRND